MCDVHQNMDRKNSVEELGFSPRPLDGMIKEIVADELARVGRPVPPQLTAGR
jgi:hypothetical protein